MMLVIIYSIILQILHKLYEFVRFIYNVCVYFTKLWSTDDIERWNEQLKSLKKKPLHLAFMLGNEEPSYKDLANIVLWSVAAGIPIISLYDHNGILKSTKSKLYNVLTEKQIQFKDVTINNQNGYKNGFSTSIQVNIISMLDGQGSVTELTKESVKNNLKSMDIEYVDQQLKKHIGQLPDPDLALYCGPMCSTFGLLPWHIRLTEFINISTHHNISLHQFVAALKMYEKSEQRYGK